MQSMCPECNALNPAENRYCANCGASLEGTKLVEEVVRPAAGAEPERKRRGPRRLLIVAAVVVALCVCGSIGMAVIGLLGTGSDATGTATVAERVEELQPTEVSAATEPLVPLASATPADTSEPPADTPIPTETPVPTDTPIPTDTAVPTDTPIPTDTPLPTDRPTPKPTPTPIFLSGKGQTATEEFVPPASISIATFSHDGSSNFVVVLYQGDDQELLINEIGPYRGSRPILGDERAMLDIDADGAWTVEIQPMGVTDMRAFSGKGSAVSDGFQPPGRGPWQISHDGQSNFVVLLYCAGGRELVQNEIGPVSGSMVIGFPKGPCFWDVQADGTWSLAPR